MSKQVQFRRGTTTEHSTFTGAIGEITVDITKDTAVVHDGVTVGGFPLLRESAYTAADVLTKIKTVDGSGSGLDADLLDGKEVADSGVNTIVQRNASGNALALGVATGTSFNSITGLASVVPVMDGIATIGTSPLVARQDHIHPNDTSKISASDIMMAIGNINSPLLDMPLKNSLSMKAGVGSATFARASTATCIDRYGMLKTAAIDEARFEKEGYLNEQLSTNVLTYSEQFDNAVWFKSNITTTANTTETLDPYGTNLADKLIENTTTTVVHSLLTLNTYFSYVAGTAYTQSIFVKAAGRSRLQIRFPYAAFGTNTGGLFDLTSKNFKAVSGLTAPTTYSILELSNGWFRISITATATVSVANYGFLLYLDNGTSLSYTGDGVSGIYIFGAQLEALPFATSYIPTTSATVTRSADVLNITRANNMPNAQSNPDGFTIAFDMNSIGQNSSLSQYAWSLYATGTDYLYSSIYGSSAIRQTLANSLAGVINSSLQSNFKKRRVISTASNSILKIFVDGFLGGTDTNTTGKLTDAANALTNIRIGGLGTATTSNFNGHLSNFRIFDKELTAQEVALA